MTIFVVTLVILMLAAVGMFAARSSQLGVTNSGRYRAMLQTHFVAEAGMQGAIHEFARDPAGYLGMLHNSPSPSVATTTGYPCFDIPFQASASTWKPASLLCLRLGSAAVQSAAMASGAPTTFNLFRLATVNAGTGVTRPGSLGRANIAPNFVVEFTDERPIDVAPPGMAVSQGPNSTLKFKAVTVRAMGQVLPAGANGLPLDITTAGPQGFMTSVETIRAEVIVGPVP